VAGPLIVKVADLVNNLNMVMGPFPKQVPIIITIAPAVPPEFLSDDMKMFWSAINFLTNACAKTETGSIHLKIYVQANLDKHQDLIFECKDTGPGVNVAKYTYLFQPVCEESDPLLLSQNHSILKDIPPGAYWTAVQNTGLGLYSVARHISSIGGKYDILNDLSKSQPQTINMDKETGKIEQNPRKTHRKTQTMQKFDEHYNYGSSCNTNKLSQKQKLT